MSRLSPRAVWLIYALGLIAVLLVTGWIARRMELAAELTSLLGGAHPGIYLEPTVLWVVTAVASLVVAVAVWVAMQRSLRVGIAVGLAFPLLTLFIWWLLVERPLQLAVSA